MASLFPTKEDVSKVFPMTESMMGINSFFSSTIFCVNTTPVTMADTVRTTKVRRLLKLTRFLILAFPMDSLLFMKQKAYSLSSTIKIKLRSKSPKKK